MSNFWLDRNVFITGATGLVGSWLTSYLVHKGANVVALVRDIVPRSILWSASGEFENIASRLVVVHGDLEDQSLLERSLNEYETDTVFHLGAQTIVGIANRNPLSTFESNVRGTYNLLEACRRNSALVKSVVVASSDKAYGSHEQLPYDETMPLHGVHPYDVSKSCADLIAYSYFKTFNVPVCVTRCGNFFGPGDLNFNRIIPQSIRHLHRGERPIIRSDGTYTRDYFYVKDGALSYMHLAEKIHTDDIAGESFNFSNELPMSVLDLVKAVASVMGVEADPVIMNEASNEIRHQYLSASKAKDILGWSPSYTLESALVETVDWYKAFLKR